MSADNEVGRGAQDDNQIKVRPKRLRDIELSFRQILIIMVILWLWVAGGYMLWSII
jgi:stress response protein SCP2